MPFDYETNVNAVLNQLTAHNTTTATPDLSSGLTTRVRTIRIDDPEVTAWKWNELPMVFIRIQNKIEELDTLGLTGSTAGRNKKSADVVYEVFGIVHKDGVRQAHSDVLVEAYRLAGNLEGVFQQEIKLSNTALFINPVNTDFGDFVTEGERAKGFRTELVAKYRFK